MSVNTAIEQLLEVEDKRQSHAYDADTVVVGLARVGCKDQLVRAGKMRELLDVDFGKPLHSLIIPAPDIHELELKMLSYYMK